MIWYKCRQFNLIGCVGKSNKSIIENLKKNYIIYIRNIIKSQFFCECGIGWEKCRQFN